MGAARPASDGTHSVAATFDDMMPEVGIGVVVPYDFVLDHELWRFAPPGVTLHVSRTSYRELDVTVEMAEEISESHEVRDAVRRLTHAAPRVTAYGCTIASYVGGLEGEAALRADMRSAGAARAVTTSGAILEALDAIGARRIGLATPYQAALNKGLEDFLESAGIAVVNVASLGLEKDIFLVDRDTVIDLAIAADHPEADAVLVSCTNLRTLEVIAALEARLDKPVLSANQVTMWSALQAAGVSVDHLDHRLFAVNASEMKHA